MSNCGSSLYCKTPVNHVTPGGTPWPDCSKGAISVVGGCEPVIVDVNGVPIDPVGGETESEVQYTPGQSGTTLIGLPNRTDVTYTLLQKTASVPQRTTSYLADPIPSWASIDANTGVLSVSPPLNERKCYFFCVRGIDQFGSQVYESVIHVAPAPDFSRVGGAQLKTLNKVMPWGGGNQDSINNEPQRYTHANDATLQFANRVDPHVDSGATLDLTVRHATAAQRADPGWSVEHWICGSGQNIIPALYTAGMLSTEGIYAKNTIRWELIAKFPAVKAMWGGFWPIRNGNPAPEVDFEWDGDRPTEIYLNVHHENPAGVHGNGYSFAWNDSDFPADVPPGGKRPGGFAWYTLPNGARIDQFNRYTIDLDTATGLITWYINGVVMDRAVLPNFDSMTLGAWFPIINMAVSPYLDQCPSWISTRDGVILPQAFEIQSLKAWG